MYTSGCCCWRRFYEIILRWEIENWENFQEILRLLETKRREYKVELAFIDNLIWKSGWDVCEITWEIG